MEDCHSCGSDETVVLKPFYKISVLLILRVEGVHSFVECSGLGRYLQISCYSPKFPTVRGEINDFQEGTKQSWFLWKKKWINCCWWRGGALLGQVLLLRLLAEGPMMPRSWPRNQRLVSMTACEHRRSLNEWEVSHTLRLLWMVTLVRIQHCVNLALNSTQDSWQVCSEDLRPLASFPLARRVWI